MNSFIDETGNRYGKLAVVERAPNSEGGKARWLCDCECGKQFIATGSGLRSGNIASCGCSRVIDEVGHRYGQLTVIEFVGIRVGKAYWLCDCDCGKRAIVRGGHLRRGDAKSCGCLKELPNGEAAFNRLLGSYQLSAKKRGIVWNLTDEQFRDITAGDCHYCGSTPSQKSCSRNGNGDYIYNGIDRVVSTIGYAIGNVVSCCWECNRMKGDMEYEEFLKQIKRIHEYLVIKEGV